MSAGGLLEYCLLLAELGNLSTFTRLVFFCLSLPLFVVGNLLMSYWTELAYLLADVLLVSSINVLLEVFPNVFCQSV